MKAFAIWEISERYFSNFLRTVFKERNKEIYREYLKELGEKVKATARRIPLIVGEWNIQNRADGPAEMDVAEKDMLYKTIVDGFLSGMEDCVGWFYWSWKVTGAGLDADCDSAERCIDCGWLNADLF